MVGEWVSQSRVAVAEAVDSSRRERKGNTSAVGSCYQATASEDVIADTSVFVCM
jgi:hypothetical protein